MELMKLVFSDLGDVLDIGTKIGFAKFGSWSALPTGESTISPVCLGPKSNNFEPQVIVLIILKMRKETINKLSQLDETI